MAVVTLERDIKEISAQFVEQAKKIIDVQGYQHLAITFTFDEGQKPHVSYSASHSQEIKID